MPLVKYRTLGPGLPPRRTQVPVPGWGGEPQPRADGSHEQVWHCVPFSEGARYGIEILYPFDQELRVSSQRGRVRLEADWGPNPMNGLNWPPFRPFGEAFYSYQIVLDLKVAPGWAIRTEPHPRFYADTAGDVPIAVPAIIRTSWWPMILFVIFKAPPKGSTHVFRKGEGFAQVIVIPAEPDITLEPMGEEEAAERELQSRRIRDSRDLLSADTRWLSSTNTVFDGTYRHLLRAAKAKEREADSAPPAAGAPASSGYGGGGDGGDGAGSGRGARAPRGSSRSDSDSAGSRAGSISARSPGGGGDDAGGGGTGPG